MDLLLERRQRPSTLPLAAPPHRAAASATGSSSSSGSSSSGGGSSGGAEAEAGGAGGLAVAGVVLASGERIRCRSVVITTGRVSHDHTMWLVMATEGAREHAASVAPLARPAWEGRVNGGSAQPHLSCQACLLVLANSAGGSCCHIQCTERQFRAAAALCPPLHPALKAHEMHALKYGVQAPSYGE